MRRPIVSLVLVGAGIFCIVLGLVVRFYAYPRVAAMPLDYYLVTESRAEDATYFDPATMTERRGRTLVATHTIRGDVTSGTRDIAVWESFDFMRDAADGSTVGYGISVVAMDRHTGEAQACCGQRVNDDRSVRRSGLAFKWPFYTERRTYPYFDETLGRALPIRYQGTERLFGLTVYRFSQRIEPTRIAELAVPGSMVGAPASPTVQVSRWYQNERTFWVEPRTGAIVKAVEQRKQTLRDASGDEVVTLFDGNVVLSDDDVRNAVRDARDGRLPVGLLHGGALWAGGLLGLLLILLGALVALYRPEEEEPAEAPIAAGIPATVT